MNKYLASIPAIILAILTPFIPAIQAWMADHVVVMTLVGVLNVVLAHLLPSPVAQRGADEPLKAPPLPVLLMALALVGCGYGKTVCTIIDTAHDACTVIRYLGPKGEVLEVRVPKGELESFARAQATKQAAQPDAGAP